MNNSFRPGLLAVAAVSIMLTACNSGSSDNSNGDSAAAVSLQNSGLYTGTLQLDNGDLALVRGYIAPDGEAVIAIEADDSERATHMVHGTIDDDYLLSGEITDGSSSETVAIALTTTAEQLNASLASTDLSGELASLLQAGAAAASLDTISGDYSRVDGAQTSNLTINSDGSFDLSGPCQDSGTVAVIDTSVNLYRLASEQACQQLGSLATLDGVEVDNDVLRLVGPRGEVDFFRL